MAIQQQRMYQQQSLSGAFPTSDALLHAHYFGSEGTGDDLSHQSAALDQAIPSAVGQLAALKGHVKLAEEAQHEQALRLALAKSSLSKFDAAGSSNTRNPTKGLNRVKEKDKDTDEEKDEEKSMKKLHIGGGKNLGAAVAALREQDMNESLRAKVGETEAELEKLKKRGRRSKKNQLGNGRGFSRWS